jgi:hypothetical protein
MSLIDLVNALEATSRNLRWRVDLVTGDLLPCTESTASVPTGERVRALPRASELPEREMRLDFCERLRDPEVRAKLIAITDAEVPRRVFEAAARREGVLDEWTAHRRSRLVAVALAWAAAQDVRCRGDSTSPSFSVN